ncbi:HNH endonuclease [Niallia sp. RD1]|uniref:HNH endonuclease n=1 Tax=Niallia sp. RD1 TaxID=2962858 RepID=UPI0020C1AE0A|nr:HNH endonuclease [Niallia sp. RD1]UTI41097.1 HNH endonuclease [Niallia sp. RD1]
MIFGDKNRRNFDINNLLLVSRKQLVRLNQNNLIQEDTELTKAAITVVDIYSKLGELKRSR